MSNVKGIATRHAKEVSDDFPVIRELEGKGCMVLFTSKADGIVLVGGDSVYEVGYRSKTWDSTQFSSFYGTVTLSTLEEE